MNRDILSHPPRPGFAREVGRVHLDTITGRREFAAACKAIAICGLAAEIRTEYSSQPEHQRPSEPTLTLYAVRRVRTVATEKRR